MGNGGKRERDLVLGFWEKWVFERGRTGWEERESEGEEEREEGDEEREREERERRRGGAEEREEGIEGAEGEEEEEEEEGKGRFCGGFGIGGEGRERGEAVF